MGSSTSSEAQAQPAAGDREPRGTIKMTVRAHEIRNHQICPFSPPTDRFVQVSSKFIDSTKRGKESEGSARPQSRESGESTANSSNVPHANSEQQTRAKPASSQDRDSLEAQEGNVGGEREPSKEMLALKELVSSVHVPENPKPHLSSDIAKIAQEHMEAPLKKIQLEEAEVLKEAQSLLAQIDAIPPYVLCVSLVSLLFLLVNLYSAFLLLY